MTPQKPKIKKRKYLRKGCQECKRRKIKCDEIKPACLRCSRLDKPCVYPPGETFRFEHVDPNKLTQARSTSVKPSLVNDVVFDPIDNIQSVFDEASLLVGNMNQFMDELLHAPGPAQADFTDIPSRPPSLDLFNPEFQVNDLVSQFAIQESPHASGYVVVDEILQKLNDWLMMEVVTRQHLTEPHITYLDLLSNGDMLYNFFPFAASIDSNGVVKLLLDRASECPYLLTALLATLATFRYNQTGRMVHAEARQKYLKICLLLLSDAFTNHIKTEAIGPLQQTQAQDIENLLLTVLVLTLTFSLMAYSSSLVMNSWQIHLHKARDVLLSYNSIISLKQFLSNGFALAKMWFFSAEAMASLFSPYGGVLLYDSDAAEVHAKLFLQNGCYDEALDPLYHLALRRIGMLTIPTNARATEFSLYLGVTVNLIKVSFEMAKAILYCRKHPDDGYDPVEAARIVIAIERAGQEEICPGFDRDTYEIPLDSPAHPKYIGPDRQVYTKAAYWWEGDKCYSWFDLSQQTHLDAHYLQLLCTQGLFGARRLSGVMKRIIRKLINSLRFIKLRLGDDYNKYSSQHDILAETAHYFLPSLLFDIRTFMIQLPYLVATRLVTSEDDFERLELFFLGLVKRGNGSALGALDLVYHCRERWRKGVGSDEEDSEVLGLIPLQ